MPRAQAKRPLLIIGHLLIAFINSTNHMYPGQILQRYFKRTKRLNMVLFTVCSLVEGWLCFVESL